MTRELGFVNVDWRKGTGLNASPADGGRDTVADRQVEEFDGSVHLKRWFVDCKHYVLTVHPADTLHCPPSLRRRGLLCCLGRPPSARWAPPGGGFLLRRPHCHGTRKATAFRPQATLAAEVPRVPAEAGACAVTSWCAARTRLR